MSRIATTFAKLKSQNRKALIPYVTAGFPFADMTPELMHGMVAAGADVIELGVPFSDPSADGPVIQKAGDKALAFGIGLVRVLAMVSTFRVKDSTTPVVLMGYANPIERYNQKHTSATAQSAFVADASAAGVDGVLVVDYPPEECEAFAFLGRIVHHQHTVNARSRSVSHKRALGRCRRVFLVVAFNRVGVAHQHDGGC